MSSYRPLSPSPILKSHHCSPSGKIVIEQQNLRTRKTFRLQGNPQLRRVRYERDYLKVLENSMDGPFIKLLPTQCSKN